MWFNLSDDDLTAIESPVRNAARVYDLILRVRRERARQERDEAEDYRNTAELLVPAWGQQRRDAVVDFDAPPSRGAWVMQWCWVGAEDALAHLAEEDESCRLQT